MSRVSKIKILCGCGQEYLLDKPRGRFNLATLLGNARCPKCGMKRIEHSMFEDQKTCAVCPMPIFKGKHRHGLCFMHYQQFRRAGFLKVRAYHFRTLVVLTQDSNVT